VPQTFHGKAAQAARTFTHIVLRNYPTSLTYPPSIASCAAYLHHLLHIVCCIPTSSLASCAAYLHHLLHLVLPTYIISCIIMIRSIIIHIDDGKPRAILVWLFRSISLLFPEPSIHQFDLGSGNRTYCSQFPSFKTNSPRRRQKPIFPRKVPELLATVSGL
jgi:hypothetical protein